MENKLEKLTESFKKEIQSRQINNLNEVELTFNSIVDSISKMDFIECVVEITSDPKIKFHLVFADDMLIFITKPVFYLDYDIEENEVFLSVIDISNGLSNKRKLMYSNVIELELK